MLPQTSAPIVPLSRETSKSTIKEKDGKKKFSVFNIFRSRSSPPKEREGDEAPAAPAPTRERRRSRQLSQPTPPGQYVQVTNSTGRPPAAPAPQMASAVAATVTVPTGSQDPRRMSMTRRIAAPIPVHADGTRNATGKMFTPFRLLSRRHRTVSTASVDAVDGTVVSTALSLLVPPHRVLTWHLTLQINAMLTGGDSTRNSTRSSTAGRPSPPLRDPLMAAQEWRNLEENEQQGRGTLRRRRPGVTFDVGEEVPSDGRPSVQKSFRANAQAQMQMQQGQGQYQQQQQQGAMSAQQAQQATMSPPPAYTQYQQPHAHAGVPLPARQATA